MVANIYSKNGIQTEEWYGTYYSNAKSAYDKNGALIITADHVSTISSLFVGEVSETCMRVISFGTISSFNVVTEDKMYLIAEMDNEESQYWQQRISEMSDINSLIDDLSVRYETVKKYIRSAFVDTKPISGVKRSN